MVYLKIIIGSMFSGKSTTLLKLFESSNNRKLLINHALDERYNKNAVTTHDNKSKSAISVPNLSVILEDASFKNSTDIFIDEAQFFDDLFESVVKMMNLDKNVYLAGLDGDYKKELFGKGDLMKLVPYCNDIIKLKAKCYKCGSDASYTFKVNRNDLGQIQVGTSAHYQPTCFKHHNSL